jgi:hypothetical protein
MNSDLKIHLIIWPVLAMLGLSLFGLLYMINDTLPKSVAIDCTWAEISPDFTPKQREECRKLRAKQ